MKYNLVFKYRIYPNLKWNSNPLTLLLPRPVFYEYFFIIFKLYFSPSLLKIGWKLLLSISDIL